jgi:hypothetical protein
MNSLDVAVLSLACTLLGVAISKIWAVASQSTTMRAEIAKTKQDINVIGKLLKDNDRKANRRNQQMIAAQLEIHAGNAEAVKRISTLLKDDSWE